VSFRKKLSLPADKVLLAALLLCFSLSLPGITVKYNHPDQMAFVPLFIEGKLPFNPGWFDKPPFHSYFNYFFSVLPVSAVSNVFEFSTQTQDIVKIVWSRVLTKWMLLAAIGLMFYILRKSSDLLSARLIALIAATTAGFLAYSHFLTVDIPVMFWMLLAFAFSHNILFERKTRDYILAGFFTGIAAATKYNGVAIGFSIVVAHVLSFRIQSWRQIPWKELLFDKKLAAGLVLVMVGFIAGNPFAILDYRTFADSFLYNYMVAPVYEGQTGHSFIRFFGRMIEIIGLPFFVISTLSVLFAIFLTIFAKVEWKKRATFILCLSVFVPYYIQFGMFPRLETRFVLPIMPLWVLMAGLFFGEMRQNKPLLSLPKQGLPVLSVLLVFLLGYNLVCSLYVGKRILDDPRLRSENWIKANMPTGSSVEKDIYSPSWAYMPEVNAQVTEMPFVSGRERLFEVLFPGNTFINGTQEDRHKTDAMVAWFSPAALMRREPDYIVIDSLFYQRFIQPGIRRDLYPSMYAYFSMLLSEQSQYQIVFDQESRGVPSWVYPQDIDFTHQRLTILALDQTITDQSQGFQPVEVGK